MRTEQQVCVCIYACRVMGWGWFEHMGVYVCVHGHCNYAMYSQVEGVVGTYFANRHAAGSRYGSTVVSFDKGGRWDLLTTPALDYRDHPVVCVPVS